MGRYATHITTPAGQRVYVSATSKEELARKVAQKRIEMGMGVDIADTTTFQEYALLWAAAYKAPPKLRPNSYETLMCNLKQHVIPYFGTLQLKAVKPMHIQGFLASLDGLSASCQKKCFDIAKAIFRTAEDNGLIYKTPIKSTDKTGGPPPKKVEPLTSDQARRLLKAVEGTKVWLFCLLALSTGLRRGEILGLMWEDVDFESSKIRVRHNKVFPATKGDAPVTELLKTDAARRYIPIPPQLRAALLKEKIKSSSPYVLHMENGESLSKNAFAAMWRSVTSRTVGKDRQLGDEIPGSGTGQCVVSLDFRCHPHQLRHTYATQCFEAGMDIKEVQYLLGHSTTAMTMQVYTHYRENCRAAETAQKAAEATSYLTGT